MDLDEFVQVRRANPPPYSFDSDGCSDPTRPIHPWEERFLDACKRHDFGSQNFGKRLHIQEDEQTRDAINQQFVDDMVYLCENHRQDWGYSACVQASNLYYQLANFRSDGFFGERPFTWRECYDNPEDPADECLDKCAGQYRVTTP